MPLRNRPSGQLFLPGLMADPFVKSAILEIRIPASNTLTFFLLLPCLDSRHHRGDSDARLPPGAGDAPPLFTPTGDGCLYLDGTIIDGSFPARRFSSLAATRLGATPFGWRR
ncbi:hypothetical protein GUJ93_ZPchr0009g1308 [Zizania palustris]|uniref:Uncharacterized protein n=1 Tax=Zizania palustris TaxID=103762 RepID=A0A8J5RWM0_ZIZPA|nr:hypothetical protein GUJ93_ZPchr0009g1308 [Zizania palustris]